ncbi:transmembrane amino acid transporter protein-domain-containing protein [Boletus edulis BED1]|uniref:Transmembrane amino acid transporter protein-domain-containing protein n=1 Tax=Boletus edulis BED1 TaxID=1328754 RepID=A0AAD4C2F3_BOLED|nr:transmembrane amino acid transporter protein-domain-containing protein [Boletus edulis BED1]
MAGVRERSKPFGTHRSRENTPLLRKAASFTVFSSPNPTNYESLSHPDDTNIVPQISAPVPSASSVGHHYNGRSTYGQTLFNCIAVLLGIGMLSEPLAFAYAGWFWGTILIIFFGLITCYTAKLLAHEILDDPRLHSYADIGRKAFGPKSSLPTNILFCLELFSLSVVLVTLTADSLEGVWPAYSANTYKVFSLFVLAPTVFMPLSILSLTSLLGISSTLLVIAVIFVDGFSKSDSPGSLWSPAHTSFSPATLGTIGVAFGLFMAGFSGHVVIPSLARDMIDPSQFDHMANRAFLVATFVYAIIGYAGYLMFGDSVSDEISRDLLATPGYNSTLNQLVMWLLVITPLSKFALSTRPLNIILESMLGLEVTSSPTSVEDGKGLEPEGRQKITKQFLVVLERIMVPAMSILVSILVPQFSSLMAFLGSFSAFVICVIGPISAKIAMTGRCRWHDAVLLGVSSLMAVWGTFSALWTT